MPVAVRAIRTDLEALLRARKLDNTLASALSLPGPLDDRVIAPTGVAVLDEQLRGGLPRGQVSEVVGPRSSGRISLLFGMLASATAREELAALVDTLDTFDAASAAACGIDLGRLLWIRGEGGQGAKVSECQGVGVQRSTEGQGDARGRHPALAAAGTRHAGAWERVVDRAIKALNLVLQAGGFGLVALDLAEVPPAVVRRLPFTTWLRLQRVIEGSETVCLLLGAEPVARSAGGVTIALWRSGQEPVASGQPPSPSVVRQCSPRPELAGGSKGGLRRAKVAGSRWSGADDRSRSQFSVHSSQCVTRDPLRTENREPRTDQALGTVPGDGRRARLFLGLEVEARLSRARWPDTTPCRIRFDAPCPL